MSIVLPIYGRLDDSLYDSVSAKFRLIPPGSIIKARFNSEGGKMEILRKLSRLFYYAEDRYDCKMYGEMIYAESAALDLYLNTRRRFVIESSIGVIHLPVARGNVSEDIRKTKTDASVAFMERRTEKMTRDDIIQNENIRLSADRMISFGIAHEKLEYFTTEPV